jgi:4'-phosphopantetheinyl transferase
VTGGVLVGWAEPDAPTAADRLLTATELERAAGFRRQADRERFRSAHVLARLVIAELAGVPVASIALHQTCRWCEGPHGRPYVDHPADAFVSWSHAGDRVVAAATYLGPVGVDVESVAAVAQARVGDDAVSWVRKESLLKAPGDGLTVPVEKVVAHPGAAVTDLDVGDGYAGCLTVLTTGEPRVEVRRFDLSGSGRDRRDA